MTDALDIQVLDDPCNQGILWGLPYGPAGEYVWELQRRDGTTERLGTLDDIRDTTAALRATNDQTRARLDQLVTEHPEFKSISPRASRDET